MPVAKCSWSALADASAKGSTATVGRRLPECVLIRCAAFAANNDLSHQPIAHATCCLDKARPFGIVCQNSADLAHIIFDQTFRHMGIRPYLLQQFLLGDQTPGVFGEVPKHRKQFWCKRHPNVARNQLCRSQFEVNG